MKSSFRIFLIVVSMIGLALTVLPSFFVFAGDISLHTHKVLMFIGTILWFITAPFWIGKKKKEKAAT